MSRALWFSSVHLAKKLLRRSELAEVHLSVSGGKVSLVTPALLEVTSNEVRPKYYDDHVSDLRQQHSSHTMRTSRSSASPEFSVMDACRLHVGRLGKGVPSPVSRFF